MTGRGGLLLLFLPRLTVQSRILRAIFSNAPLPFLQVIPPPFSPGLCHVRMTYSYAILHQKNNQGSGDALRPIRRQVIDLCVWISIQGLKLSSHFLGLNIYPCTIYFMYKEAKKEPQGDTTNHKSRDDDWQPPARNLYFWHIQKL